MVNEYECELLGLDVKKVAKLEKDIYAISKRAGKLGLHIFGGSSNTLRCGSIIVADNIGSNFDGGDGGISWYNGVLVGETAGIEDAKELHELIDRLIEEYSQQQEQEMLEDKQGIGQVREIDDQ